MMLAYVDKSMLHLTQTGGTFQTQSSGLGDVKISVNQVLSEVETTNGVHRFGLTYGISLPTGSIDEEDFLPAIAANARLLASAASQPILTIADQDVSKVDGAIITLYRKGTRQKFGINRNAARLAGLTLSSQLLQIATVVD